MPGFRERPAEPPERHWSGAGTALERQEWQEFVGGNYDSGLVPS
ncbi:hypothetical protein [Streptosporangium sp. NPDC000509]